MTAMVDAKDMLILEALKKNARASTKAIAASTHLPRVTVHDRIQKMLQHGIIKAFNVSINYQKLDINTEAYIFISFLPNPDISQRELARRIAALHGVYEVHIISGEYDLLLKVRGTTIEEIGTLVIDKLRKLNGVGRTLTCACFETVKEEP
jgi:Lrp/AsnC family transcriptional regulator, leucine-responsive regulatory protein